MLRRLQSFIALAIIACQQPQEENIGVEAAPIATITQAATACATYDALAMTHSTGGATSGGWNIWSNGSISASHSFAAGQTTITVSAAGRVAAGVWPSMSVYVGTTRVGTASVASTSYLPYAFAFTATAGAQTIRVQFDNDFVSSSEDRNLLVKNVAVSCPVVTDTAQYNFENGATHGWVAQGASSVASSTAQAFKGSASLAVRFTSAGGTQTARLSTAPPAGSTVAFNVYCASGVTWVQPYANAPWTGAYTAVPTFALGKWNARSVTVPPGATEIGVQFRVTSGYTGSCYVDSVGWQTTSPPPPPPPPTDTTPPTIALAAPIAGIVTASVSDDVGVVGVRFTVDGVAQNEDTTAPFAFDTSGLAPGAHVITARARDAAGNATTSAALNVTIANGIVEPGSPGVVDVAFTVRADTDTHAISPLIYGSNTTAQTVPSRLGMQRLGGNRWTTYNWENNASNAGSDYCFQNDGYLSSSNVPGAAVKSNMDTASSVGAATLLTIPIVDYVAADKLGNCDVRNSGSNYLQTRFKQNRARKGTTPSATPDAGDAFVYQDEFVTWVKSVAPSTPLFFSMDNEPDLWSSTHAEIHPNGVGYDELVNRNITFASMVKSLAPNAKTTGFVSYGFLGFVNLQNAPDASGKGEFIDYYLAKMRAAEQQYGERLIDYLDLHWYPEAKGGGVRIIGNDTSAAVVAARLQAPRSLWDSTYKETSWVADYLGAAVNLIPREKAKIAAGYPGTSLAFTEWNYGGGNHISGALAVADVLGIFGRDDVGLASYWNLNGSEPFAYAAFRAYRNFDGAGARFGDTSIHADTSRRDTSSVYASYDAANPSRVVIVAINKLATPAKAGITLAHASRFTSAQVYTVTSASSNVTPAGTITAVAQNAFAYTMPAYSISVIVPKP